MITCWVVPYAAESKELCVLAKLFVLGNNPSLQKTAGSSIRDTIFHLLHKNKQNLQDILQLEQILRCGLNVESVCEWKPTLASLFAEVYNLTIMLTAFAFKDSTIKEREKFHLSRGNLKNHLKDFESKCLQRHQSNIGEHLKFHIGLSLELLQSDIWSSKNKDAVDEIIQTMRFCIQASQSPVDRKKTEDDILGRFAGITKTERCLLLHYFASAVQRNQSIMNICNAIFKRELERAHGSRLKREGKSKKLLISCAVLCVHMCSSIQQQGKYSDIFWKK